MAQEAPIDPIALRADIERTRAELGETIQALAAKTDVKARAKEAVSDATDGVRQHFAAGKSSVRARLDRSQSPAVMRRPTPVAVGAVAGAMVGALIYLLTRPRTARWRP